MYHPYIFQAAAMQNRLQTMNKLEPQSQNIKQMDADAC